MTDFKVNQRTFDLQIMKYSVNKLLNLYPYRGAQMDRVDLRSRRIAEDIGLKLFLKC